MLFSLLSSSTHILFNILNLFTELPMSLAFFSILPYLFLSLLQFGYFFIDIYSAELNTSVLLLLNTPVEFLILNIYPFGISFDFFYNVLINVVKCSTFHLPYSCFCLSLDILIVILKSYQLTSISGSCVVLVLLSFSFWCLVM